jgi:hypothetical protein
LPALTISFLVKVSRQMNVQARRYRYHYRGAFWQLLPSI